MSTKEMAKARGVSPSSVSGWARRNGVKFRDARKDPEHAERIRKMIREKRREPEFAQAHAERSRERMRKLNRDPEFAKATAERMRQRHRDPEFVKAHWPHLAGRTDQQRKEYRALRRRRATKAQALAALGFDKEGKPL